MKKQKRRGRKSRGSRKLLTAGYVLLILCSCCICCKLLETEIPETHLRTVWPEPAVERQLPVEKAVNLDGLYSQYAVLMDAETGQVLAEKNGGERIYPASMTKLLTALEAVEHTESWGGSVKIPPDIFSELYAEHASLAGFEPGEKVMPEDLLYGMLLPSGAECCSAYAMYLAEDEETFTGWMNGKAEELGMDSSHFTNTSGLHEEEHYSTARDIAVLLRACIQNEILRRALSAESFQTISTAQHPHGLNLQSTLFQTIETDPDLSAELESLKASQVTLLGGKTGYTSEAGLCLASFARVGDREYILVTAKADGNHSTEPYHIMDALKVYARIGENL